MGNAGEGDEWGDEVEDKAWEKEKNGMPGGEDEGVKRGPDGDQENNGKDEGSDATTGEVRNMDEKFGKNIVGSEEKESEKQQQQENGVKDESSEITTGEVRDIDEKSEEVAENEDKKTDKQPKES